MLSVFFNSDDFPDTPTAIEAWGWDNRRGRYNYYKLDNTGTPDLRLCGSFVVRLEGADLLSPSDRADTCMACHINGAPVMKELSRPWNNWHSLDSQITYLATFAPDTIRWPVANNMRLKDGRLRGAEELEVGGILPSISQFNNRRITAALAKRDADGNLAIDDAVFAQVVEGKRLLKPVFINTEFNIISSLQKSGLHPFPKIATLGPKQAVIIPKTFFLNANRLAGEPSRAIEAWVSPKLRLSTLRLSLRSIKKLVIDSRVKLGDGDREMRILPGLCLNRATSITI